jgi:hypothetical protein
MHHHSKGCNHLPVMIFHHQASIMPIIVMITQIPAGARGQDGQ